LGEKWKRYSEHFKKLQSKVNNDQANGAFAHGEKWKQCSQQSSSHNRWKERYNQMGSFLIGSMFGAIDP
jgi:hypothetical protein